MALNDTNPIFYESDCNLSILDGKTIAIIGYGSQGRRLRIRASRFILLMRPQEGLISS